MGSKVRTNLSKLDYAFNKDINTLKGSGLPSETNMHYIAKAMVCKTLLNSENKFVTEARFKDNKGRVDVLDLTKGICYEILHSEKEANILLKESKYPLPVIPINAKKLVKRFINESM